MHRYDDVTVDIRERNVSIWSYDYDGMLSELIFSYEDIERLQDTLNDLMPSRVKVKAEGVK